MGVGSALAFLLGPNNLGLTGMLRCHSVRICAAVSDGLRGEGAACQCTQVDSIVIDYSQGSDCADALLLQGIRQSDDQLLLSVHEFQRCRKQMSEEFAVTVTTASTVLETCSSLSHGAMCPNVLWRKPHC